jgi:hypothetical protein
MTLRGTDPESYITEYASVYEDLFKQRLDGPVMYHVSMNPVT